jgi:hypothetical protein
MKIKACVNIEWFFELDGGRSLKDAKEEIERYLRVSLLEEPLTPEINNIDLEIV